VGLFPPAFQAWKFNVQRRRSWDSFPPMGRIVVLIYKTTSMKMEADFSTMTPHSSANFALCPTQIAWLGGSESTMTIVGGISPLPWLTVRSISPVPCFCIGVSEFPKPFVAKRRSSCHMPRININCRGGPPRFPQTNYKEVLSNPQFSRLEAITIKTDRILPCLGISIVDR